MKLIAMRFGQDDEDIEVLIRECDIKSAEEALALLEHIYPKLEPPLKNPPVPRRALRRAAELTRGSKCSGAHARSRGALPAYSWQR